MLNVERFDYVTTPDELVPMPGAAAAVARLNAAGLPVVVVTNQGGIARGLYTEADLAAIHAKLYDHLADGGARLDDLIWCPAIDDADPWRKPRPGMLREAARRLGLAPAQAVMIGDSLRDVEAARRCGARAVLVRTGKGRRDEPLLAEQWYTVDHIADDLAAAVDWILGR